MPEAIITPARGAPALEVIMQQQQLTMFRGNTMVFDFAVTLGGNPVALTSAGVWFTAKTSPGAGTVVFQKAVGSGITVTDAASGAGMINLVPSDTQALGARTVPLYFDLEVALAGAVYTTAAGRLVVEPDVTVRE
jgi:hypothetical protein